METKNKSKAGVVVLVIIVILALGVLSYYSKEGIKKFFGFATVYNAFVYDDVGQRAVDNSWGISADSYAWNENTGWIDFASSTGSATYVADNALWGYAYGENVGWISLNCNNADSCDYSYKVANNGEGKLSGYAWNENTGWIDFGTSTNIANRSWGVSIDSDGEFIGYAYGENVGWISFNHLNGGDVDYKVSTNWRWQSLRTQCNNGLDDDSNGSIDYPDDSSCENLSDDLEKYTGGNKVIYKESVEERERSQSSSTSIINNNENNSSTSTSTSTSTASTTNPTSTPPKVLTPIKTIELPVTVPEKIILKDLPVFNDSISGKSSTFTFVPQLSLFLFAPLPNSVQNTLKETPKLKDYLTSLGLTKEQNFVSLIRNPLILPPSEDTIPGLFSISNGTTTLRTYLTNDMCSLAQSVRVASGTKMIISLASIVSGEITGLLNNSKTVYFSNNGKNVSTNITLGSGRYILKTSASPLPLIIEVISPTPISQTTNSSTPWFYKVLDWLNL